MTDVSLKLQELDALKQHHGLTAADKNPKSVPGVVIYALSQLKKRKNRSGYSGAAGTVVGVVTGGLGAVGGGGAGMMGGAAAGSAIPGVGTLAGSVAGAGIGGAIGGTAGRHVGGKVGRGLGYMPRAMKASFKYMMGTRGGQRFDAAHTLLVAASGNGAHKALANQILLILLDGSQTLRSTAIAGFQGEKALSASAVTNVMDSLKSTTGQLANGVKSETLSHRTQVPEGW